MTADPRDPAAIQLSTVEQWAAAHLDPTWYAYFAGGAAAERTLRGNVTGFDRFELRPRVLAEFEAATAATRVLGHELSMPVLTAPMAFMRMAHPDGDEGIARAVAATGAGMLLSTLSPSTPAEVAAAAPTATRWLQLYVLRDRGLSDDLVAEALEAGFSAIVLTADLPVIGSRGRELASGWAIPEDELPALVRARRAGATERGFDLLDPTVSWGEVDRLASQFGVPVVVKGILRADDAVLAADHGAAGIVVSNHGGRQLDGAPPAIAALPAIAEAAGDRVEVLLDGGVRHGSDVVTALGLGARAVLVGRQVLWGLAVGGEPGARRVLELLGSEIAVALRLLGCASPAEVGRDRVNPRD